MSIHLKTFIHILHFLIFMYLNYFLIFISQIYFLNSLFPRISELRFETDKNCISEFEFKFVMID